MVEGLGYGANPIDRDGVCGHAGEVTCTVIVVDNDAGFRRIASALLSARGLDVIGEAVDRASAIEAVSQLHPAYVLLDVQLGSDDGYQTAADLLMLSSHLRILMTSTSPDFDDADSGLPFISKDQLAVADLAELLSPAGK